MRGIARRSLALASAFGVALGASLVVGPATVQAYTYAEIEPNSGASPTVATTMSHSFAEGVEPAPNAEFTYNGTATIGGLNEPGTAYSAKVSVSAGGVGSFKGDVTADSFKVDGDATVSKVEKDGDSYIATIDNLTGDTTVTFTHPGVVDSQAGPGMRVTGSMQARVDVTPTISYAGRGYIGFQGNNGTIADCEGSQVYQYEIGDSGAWLADIKFGDVEGKYKVMPDNGALKPASQAEVLNYTKNTINIQTADGRDITGEIMDMSKYNPDDPSKPFAPGNASAYPNTRWVDSVNFPYDPATWTGKAWLPAGTVVTIDRGVTYGACTGNGISTDLTAKRELGVNMDIARVNTSETDLAVDSFTLPGEVAPRDLCEDLVYSNGDSTKATVKLGQATLLPNGKLAAKLVGTTEVGTEAIAIPHAKEYHNRIYYLTKSHGLYYYDANDGSNNFVGTIFKFDQEKNKQPFAAAFDQNDQLIFMANTKLKTWYSLDVLSGSTRPVEYPYKPTNLTPNSYVRDIAFDKAGNAYFTANASNTDDTGVQLYKLPVGTTKAIKLGSPESGSVNGLAFGKDGKLYAGSGNNIWRVDTETGELTKVPWNNGGPSGIGDLTSCNYDVPEPPTGGTPEFSVEKSAIDPSTGAVVKAGESAGNGVTIAQNGTGTVQYLVTVTNKGSGAGTPEAITDNISVPAGFKVENVQIKDLSKASDNVSDQGNKTELTLQAGELGGTNNSQSWLITVKVKADDPASIDWSAIGECNTEGAGQPGTGFFNSVTMTDDKDGDENNDACVPVNPKGKLILKKRIIDSSTGAEVAPEDLDKFNLSASNIANDPSGVVGTNGATAAVNPGTYQLAESPKDNGETTGYYQFGAWECDGGELNAPESQIKVAANETVTCTVTNTRTPKVHIEKFANDATEDNPHKGKPVVADADGNVDMVYKVVVTNDSNFAGNVGAISDTFGIPAGMEWRTGANATVAEAEGVQQGTTVGLKSEITEAELEDYEISSGVNSKRFDLNIAEGITDMGPGTHTYIVTVPLRITASPTTEEGKQQLATLGECEDKSTENGTKHTTTAKGVANRTTLIGEDYTYNSEGSIKDNVACIPVVLPKVHVEKLAADPSDGNSHIGKPIAVPKNGEFTTSYKIVVTNNTDSDEPVTTGAITDTFTVPEGLVWDGSKKATVTDDNADTADANGAAEGLVTELSQEQLAGGAEIATKVVNLPKDATHTFTITIPLKLDTADSGKENPDQPGTNLTNAQANESKLGTCEDNPESLTPGVTTKTSGIANQVSLVGEDQTYNDKTWEKDNIACVPIELPGTWKVQKEAKTDDGWAAKGAPIKAGTTQTGYEVTTTYRVRVTNNGSKAGTHPEIYDNPSLPSPWNIDSVKIAKTEADLASAPALEAEEKGYKIPFTESVEGFRSAEYFIQVHATADNVLPEEWEKIGECNVEKGGNAKLGAFNKVTMEDDTDGEDNNDACVPVTPGESPKVPGPSIEKTDINGTPVAGAVFALYDQDPSGAVEPIEVLQGTDGSEKWDATTKPASKFTMETKLERGKTYWIKELKSPSSEYTLLPVPLKFIAKDTSVYVPMDGMNEAPGVCPDSKPDCSEEEKTRTIDGGTYTLTGNVLKVADPRAGELPKAGGIGHWTLAGGAGVLIMVSLMFMFRANPRRN
ncbi:hypothetical protein CAQU_00775 [Corynebacterium aquilae DSM 44791]|uniref:Uncharacterized protein n=2 Tax=Corynebacterium aquilae TaxID=203263 RepID=A0A1L7CDE6_9CORY|nr:hypothetical protein CAQU_00775 [Corynebacterium aquilae DSM 44791]